ncbi:MAG: ABC transporter permease subunit [Aigarchaeota archaeon]|nr:ABC transporter permease subunit [Candidatus Geocrenenecus dongiae]
MDPTTLLEILGALGYSWMRMTIALLLSIIFSIFVGMMAATSRLLEKIIIPTLDVLQSIPILGFFPIALYAFIMLHPVIGPELAAIFLIFTSQVWNIAFGVYEAVKAVPVEVLEASRVLRLKFTDRLRHIYLPASFPKIAVNLPPSWANGLYFLVACEFITIGEREYRLFGIGTITTEFLTSGRILEAVSALASVVVAVVFMNIFFFIPLIRVSERFKFEVYATEVPHAWFEKLAKPISLPIRVTLHRPIFSEHWKLSGKLTSLKEALVKHEKTIKKLFIVLLVVFAVYLSISPAFIEFTKILIYGFLELGLELPLTSIGYSLVRVFTALFITLLWTIPVAIVVYEKEVVEKVLVPIFQVVSSFPSTLLIPFIADFVTRVGLAREFGALLMVLLGTQWYMFFFIRGALATIPREEEELFKLLRIRGFRKFLNLYFPRLLPSMIIGCIVTVGGAWNTLVVAERSLLDSFTWEVEYPGIGKLLSIVTEGGDLSKMIAVTIWMAIVVVILNRFIWRKLHKHFVEKIS